MFSRMLGAFLLSSIFIAPSFSQQFPTSAEIIHPAPKKNNNTPRYALAYGKVLARIDAGGVTKFNYQNGSLISENLPNGIVGTYLYDRAGKFEGISYSDGKTIRVVYNSNGSIKGLADNSKGKVKFSSKYNLPPKTASFSEFLTIQDGVSALMHPQDVCISDEPDQCIVYVPAPPPEDGGGGGIGGGGGFPIPAEGGGGTSGGGGDPIIYARTGTAYPTVEECKEYVCEKGKSNFDDICRYFARPGADKANCYAKSMEYYSRCLPSCERADWSWLSGFNFIWG